MQRVYSGNTFGIWFDTEQDVFVLAFESYQDDMAAEKFKDEKFSYHRSRHLFYIDAKGQIIKHERLVDGHVEELESNPKYKKVLKTTEKQYPSDYKFSQLKGIFSLEHFQRIEFTWPYIYYFIPVIGFDWKGIAYVNFSHNDEEFKFKIPMDSYSRLLYLDTNHDGQLYYYPTQEYIPGMAFFEVDESHYTSVAGSSKENHREGLGLYVVYRK